jgi:2-polyprenyl-3-methyl-5-hydroxy-6-metoxy-1,4-benzoquinol methylase
MESTKLTEKRKQPKPLTAPNVHETVARLLIDEPRGKVLDVGAGEGALTSRIKRMGFDVEACDFSKEYFKVDSIVCKTADLNSALPYRNDFFDYCLCVEVIEHLHDPWHLISEINRIMKRDGKLVITTPNIHSIVSRLRFLLYGEHSFFLYNELKSKSTSVPERLLKHINPVSFPELEHILLENRMEIDQIATNKYYNKDLSNAGLISRILYPPTKTIMLSHFGRETFFTSDELIAGQVLILKVKKN